MLLLVFWIIKLCWFGGTNQYSSKTLVFTYKFTWYYIQGDQYCYLHHYENLELIFYVDYQECIKE
jgi:hypothetical protein